MIITPIIPDYLGNNESLYLLLDLYSVCFLEDDYLWWQGHTWPAVERGEGWTVVDNQVDRSNDQTYRRHELQTSRQGHIQPHGTYNHLGTDEECEYWIPNWSLNFMFCFQSPTYFQPWGHPTADKKHLHLSPPTGIDSTLRQDMAWNEGLWKLKHKAVLNLTLSPRDEESIFHGESLRPEQCVCCVFSHQLK